MKRSMISMAAVLFAALMTTTVLTSCSSSDSDEPKKPEFTKTVVKYTVNSDDATLGLFKLNVYGTDADGNAFVETMSNPSYSKTVEIPVSKLPCTVEYYIVVTPLEDKVATEDFDVKIERNIDAMSLLSDNTVSGVVKESFNKYINKIEAGTSLSEFAEILNNYGKVIISIDANGKLTKQTKSSI